MKRSCVLALVGLSLLSLALFTGFQWVGVTYSRIMRVSSPRFGTHSVMFDEHLIGVQWGVLYGFAWEGGMNLTMYRPPPVSEVSHWGIVHPVEMPRDTCLGFSFRGEDMLYIGHGPYGLGQWSFPIWSVALLLLIPDARERWRRFREGRADLANLCRACGYDLRTSISRCPECGTPIPIGARAAE